MRFGLHIPTSRLHIPISSWLSFDAVLLRSLEVEVIFIWRRPLYHNLQNKAANPDTIAQLSTPVSEVVTRKFIHQVWIRGSLRLRMCPAVICKEDLTYKCDSLFRMDSESGKVKQQIVQMLYHQLHNAPFSIVSKQVIIINVFRAMMPVCFIPMVIEKLSVVSPFNVILTWSDCKIIVIRRHLIG